jgi:hypothetical protein
MHNKSYAKSRVRCPNGVRQPVNGDEIGHAWDTEIRARVKAVDEGRVSGIPYDQIQKEIADRLGSR